MPKPKGRWAFDKERWRAALAGAGFKNDFTLAKRLKNGPSTVSRWHQESGPDFDHLVPLLDVLQVSLEYLLGREGQAEAKQRVIRDLALVDPLWAGILGEVETLSAQDKALLAERLRGWLDRARPPADTVKHFDPDPRPLPHRERSSERTTPVEGDASTRPPAAPAKRPSPRPGSRREKSGRSG